MNAAIPGNPEVDTARPNSAPYPASLLPNSSLDALIEHCLLPSQGDGAQNLRMAGEAAEGGWPALLDRAGQHGLAAVLFQKALQAGAEIPAAAREAFEAQLVFERLAQAGQQAALLEALALLKARGIEALVLKGSPLAQRLYGDPALRPSSDIDLLIAEQDLDAAISALEGADFRAETGPAARHNRRHLHHVAMERRGSVPIELHFKAFTGFGATIPSEPLLSRSRPAAVPSSHPLPSPSPSPSHSPSPSPSLSPALGLFSESLSALPTLDPLDELVFLVAHAAGHLYARLGWLYEIKLLIAQTPGLDLRAAAARAKELHVHQAFAFTFAQYGPALVNPLPLLPNPSPLTPNPSPLPPGPWSLAPGPSLRFSLARAALSIGSRKFRRHERPTLARLFFQAALADRAIDSARFLALHLSRIARRRIQKLLPRLAPEDWAG